MDRKIFNIKWQTIKSRKDDPKAFRTANTLSIYCKTPIEIDGTKAESVAGFIIGIYYPESDSRRKQAFCSWGSTARLLTSTLAKAMRKNGNYIFWKGEKIAFGSKEHCELMEKALVAKFEQNKIARDALVSTQGFTLTNKEGGEGKYKFPAKKFCEILTRVRDEFVKKTDSFFILANINTEQSCPFP